jgi:Spore germination protein.
MNKVHISGYSSMIYFVLRSTFISILVPFLVLYKQDSILVCLVGSFFSFILFNIYLSFLKRNKHKNIIVYLSKKLPRIIGFIMNTVISISIFLFGMFVFCKLINFTSNEYLKQTPIILIAIFFFIFICYLAKKSFITLSKACFIFLSISLFLYFVKIFGLISEVKIDNIMPLYKISANELLIGSLKYAVITTMPLFLLLQVSKENIEPNKNLIKKAKIIFALTSLLLFINVFLMVSVIGPNLMNVYNYPDFHLLSNIKLLGFINKLESLLSIQWIIEMIVCISLCFLYIKSYFKYYLSPQFNNNKSY